MTRWVMASGEGDPTQEVGGFREWESNVLSLRTEMSGTVLSVELSSSVIRMFCVHLHCGSHYPLVAIAHLKCGWCY